MADYATVKMIADLFKMLKPDQKAYVTGVMQGITMEKMRGSDKVLDTAQTANNQNPT